MFFFDRATTKPLQEIISNEAIAFNKELPVLEETVKEAPSAKDIENNLKGVAEKVVQGVLTHEIELNAKIQTIKAELSVVTDDSPVSTSSSIDNTETKAKRVLLQYNSEDIVNEKINESAFSTKILQYSILLLGLITVVYYGYKIVGKKARVQLDR